MAFGLECYDSTGSTIFSSPTQVVDFYAGRASVYTSDFTPTFTGFTDLRSTVTRKDEYSSAAYVSANQSFLRLSTSHGLTFFNVNATGVVSNGLYYAPSRQLTRTYNNILYTTDQAIYDQGCRVGTFDGWQYSFGRITSEVNGYGFTAFNVSGDVVATSQAGPMYIQPDSGGNKERTVSLSSVGLNDSLLYNKYISTRDVNWTEQAASITFEKGYTRPPLIFLSDSGGVPIAIWGYKKTDGLFTGVTLTTAAAPSGTVLTDCPYQHISASAAWAFKTNQNATCKVLVVSDEYPDYLAEDSYGLQTFDSAGNVAFDSRYSVSAFTTGNYDIPYWRARRYKRYSTGSGAYYKDHLNTSSFSETGTQNAVCLNSFSAATGYLADLATSPNNISGFDYVNTAFNLYGRYCAATQSTNTQYDISAGGTGYVKIIGTCRELRQYPSIGDGGYPFSSVDAHIGRTSTFDVIKLSW